MLFNHWRLFQPDAGRILSRVSLPLLSHELQYSMHMDDIRLQLNSIFMMNILAERFNEVIIFTCPSPYYCGSFFLPCAERFNYWLYRMRSIVARYDIQYAPCRRRVRRPPLLFRHNEDLTTTCAEIERDDAIFSSIYWIKVLREIQWLEEG
jgi:hypothetical protein